MKRFVVMWIDDVFFIVFFVLCINIMCSIFIIFGIVIGVVLVVVMILVGFGVEKNVISFIKSFGLNIIMIILGVMWMCGVSFGVGV